MQNVAACTVQEVCLLPQEATQKYQDKFNISNGMYTHKIWNYFPKII